MIRRWLGPIAADGEHLIVVSDADGLLLWLDGETKLRSAAADAMNFVEGALWSEAGAGTNAVGTALAAAHAVQVFAAEHFTASVQRWTCAAAPVIDPDSGQLLGVIDLTGDISSVHPHSLSVVVATARAVEEVLRQQMRERDAALRERHGALVRPESSRAALVTATGRVLLDPTRSYTGLDADGIPPGGGPLVLPSGTQAVAEPVDGGELYLVRPRAVQARARPLLELRLLGDEAPTVSFDGTPLRMRRRHVELLTLLALRRTSVTADVLCAELYGDDGHPASIRVEMSRLRKALGGSIEPEGYRLTCDVRSDLQQVRDRLSRNDVPGAAAAYAGPLLPDSSSPGICSAREELDGWLRQAVITSEDPDAIWAWVDSPSGENDLVAWLRLLAALDYADPRRSRAVARTAALRRSFTDVADV